MSVLPNTDPVYGQQIEITCLKWLQSLRSQRGITDPATEGVYGEDMGTTLNKILSVYTGIPIYGQ